MAKERLFDLPETKGVFQLKGLVTGTEKDGFYKESVTATKKDMRRVNFGVTFNKDKTLYVNLQGIPKDKVVFSKSGKNGEKPEVVKVPWAQRHNFNKEGFGLVGVNLGLTKMIDEKGNHVNVKKRMTEFDACKEVYDCLNGKDGVSVFVKGKIEYSSFTGNNNELKRNVKFIPNQISLCSDIKFDDEKFTPINDFTQTIIFMGIDQEKENDKPTGRYVVEAKIITYQTIEDAEFIITDAKLAQLFKKNLKPYYAIEVHGKLDTFTETEVVNDDCWGEENAMEKVAAPTRREMIITGAKPSTIDTDTYKKELVEEAIAKIKNAEVAKNDFGSTDDGWGNYNDLNSVDEEEPW